MNSKNVFRPGFGSITQNDWHRYYFKCSPKSAELRKSFVDLNHIIGDSLGLGIKIVNPTVGGDLDKMLTFEPYNGNDDGFTAIIAKENFNDNKVFDKINSAGLAFAIGYNQIHYFVLIDDYKADGHLQDIKGDSGGVCPCSIPAT